MSCYPNYCYCTSFCLLLQDNCTPQPQTQNEVHQPQDPPEDIRNRGHGLTEKTQPLVTSGKKEEGEKGTSTLEPYNRDAATLEPFKREVATLEPSNSQAATLEPFNREAATLETYSSEAATLETFNSEAGWEGVEVELLEEAMEDEEEDADLGEGEDMEDEDGEEGEECEGESDSRLSSYDMAKRSSLRVDRLQTKDSTNQGTVKYSIGILQYSTVQCSKLICCGSGVFFTPFESN